MFKLYNSCCRYIWHPCERVEYKALIKKLNKINSNWKICSTECSDGGRAIHTGAVPKKECQTRISAINRNYNIAKTKSMSDHQPNVNPISHGGTFEVSSLENSSLQDWLKESDNSSAVSSSTQNKRPFKVPANFRSWETLCNNTDKSEGSSFKFKVMSYNVLSQYLLECHPYLYTECAPKNLKWKVRSAKIYDEIIKLAPDILCLQEVQASHLKCFYSKFEDIGYSGIFKQKTGQGQDGCAIYYKKSQFKMIEHVSVEYNQPGLAILNRDNIGIMVKLIPHSLPGTPLVVATTHLLYNPKRTDVRLAQMQLFLAEIDRFAYYSRGVEPGHVPIILTGDFNSTPESAVVTLLDRGHVSASQLRDNSDWQSIAVTDNCQHLSVYLDRQEGRALDDPSIKIYNSEHCPSPSEPECRSSHVAGFKELFNSSMIKQFLHLVSAYNKLKPDGDEEATTFQDDWVTVDYIYFSRMSTLRLVERLRLPSVSECAVLGRLPNDVYGSDHLALVVSFELKPYKSAL